MWRACHIASADSRVAITSRRGACGDVIVKRAGSATAAWGVERSKRGGRRALLAILASAPLALACVSPRAQEAKATPAGTRRPPLARAAQLDAASDLAADGAASLRERKPILLFFDRQECPYCEQALREYLVPLSRESGRDRALFRQVDIDRPLPVVDFDGSTTTHDRIASRYRARLSPTVIVVAGDGAILAGPLVGLMSVDFYGAYLERALDDAQRKLSSRPLS